MDEWISAPAEGTLLPCVGFAITEQTFHQLPQRVDRPASGRLKCQAFTGLHSAPSRDSIKLVGWCTEIGSGYMARGSVWQLCVSSHFMSFCVSKTHVSAHLTLAEYKTRSPNCRHIYAMKCNVLRWYGRSSLKFRRNRLPPSTGFKSQIIK
jgi:hypothetical protein